MGCRNISTMEVLYGKTKGVDARDALRLSGRQHHPEILIAPDSLPPPDIRVEVTRANATIVVKWPLQDSAACAVWLRELLR